MSEWLQYQIIQIGMWTKDSARIMPASRGRIFFLAKHLQEPEFKESAYGALRPDSAQVALTAHVE